MDEGDMYESEVITFVAPKQSGWLKKKSTGEFFQANCDVFGLWLPWCCVDVSEAAINARHHAFSSDHLSPDGIGFH